MNPNYREIFNYALDNAIKNNDSVMARKCLVEGAIITSESVSLFTSMVSKIESCYPEHKQVQSNTSADKTKILNLLLIYGFKTVISDQQLITKCFFQSDKKNITAIINAGYNGSCAGSVEILKLVIQTKNVPLYMLSLLFVNGFDVHIQSILMDCIECNNHVYLPLLLGYGANFYSVLDKMHEYCTNCRIILLSKQSLIFAMDNIYNISMLIGPIKKYFLIRSMHVEHNSVLHIEICVYIFQLFMEIDYVRTNFIHHKIKLKPTKYQHESGSIESGSSDSGSESRHPYESESRHPYESGSDSE